MGQRYLKFFYSMIDGAVCMAGGDGCVPMLKRRLLWIVSPLSKAAALTCNFTNLVKAQMVWGRGHMADGNHNKDTKIL